METNKEDSSKEPYSSIGTKPAKWTNLICVVAALPIAAIIGYAKGILPTENMFTIRILWLLVASYCIAWDLPLFWIGVKAAIRQREFLPLCISLFAALAIAFFVYTIR